MGILNHQKIRRTRLKHCSVHAQIHTLMAQSVCAHIWVPMITCSCRFYIQFLKATQVGMGQTIVRTSGTPVALVAYPCQGWERESKS